MNWKSSVSKNEFMPEEDVIRKTEDGRDIVIARKGSPLPMEKAVKLGLVEVPEEKKSAKKGADASENKKADSGAENKSAKKQ